MVLSLPCKMVVYLDVRLTPFLKAEIEGVACSEGRYLRSQYYANPQINVGVGCRGNLTVINCNSADTFHYFTPSHSLLADHAMTKTSGGYHDCVKLCKPITSQRLRVSEVKHLGSYAATPLPICLSASPYVLNLAHNGMLLEVRVQTWLGLPPSEIASQASTVSQFTVLGTIYESQPTDK